MSIAEFPAGPGAAYEGAWDPAHDGEREYGGAGRGNLGGVMSQPLDSHGRPDSIEIVLPPCLLNPPPHDDPARSHARAGRVRDRRRTSDPQTGTHPRHLLTNPPGHDAPPAS